LARCCFALQVFQYLFDHHRVFDAGDDLHRPLAVAAHFYFDIA
jgi:hypothetical protein